MLVTTFNVYLKYFSKILLMLVFWTDDDSNADIAVLMMIVLILCRTGELLKEWRKGEV